MIAAATVTAITAFSLWDHLTPAEMLAIRLHEKNGRHILGSVCKDGWLSHSRGSGTCSHHKGVAYQVDTIIYEQSMQECHKKAAKISWLPQ